MSGMMIGFLVLCEPPVNTVVATIMCPCYFKRVINNNLVVTNSNNSVFSLWQLFCVRQWSVFECHFVCYYVHYYQEFYSWCCSYIFVVCLVSTTNRKPSNYNTEKCWKQPADVVKLEAIRSLMKCALTDIPLSLCVLDFIDL